MRHFQLYCPRPRPPSDPKFLPWRQVKDLVELVQKARMSKILAGLATLGGAITVKLNNLAAMEINAGRGGAGCGHLQPVGRRWPLMWLRISAGCAR